MLQYGLPSEIFSVLAFFVSWSLWFLSVYWQFRRISNDKIHDFGLVLKITDKNHVSGLRKKVWQRNELTRKGTLSPSMRLLPLRTRTELLGYSVGGFTNEIESYSQLKMTHLAEKMHILTNQRKMTLTETCAHKNLCYTQKISH